jgi:pimeloyl-ACP methyl ester carboxylesterase
MMKQIVALGGAAALVGGLASTSAPAPAVALAPAPAAKPAPVFKPTRFSVEVRGTGPDVILIPGLASSSDVWDSTAAAVPAIAIT